MASNTAWQLDYVLSAHHTFEDDGVGTECFYVEDARLCIAYHHKDDIKACIRETDGGTFVMEVPDDDSFVPRWPPGRNVVRRKPHTYTESPGSEHEVQSSHLADVTEIGPATVSIKTVQSDGHYVTLEGIDYKLHEDEVAKVERIGSCFTYDAEAGKTLQEAPFDANSDYVCACTTSNNLDTSDTHTLYLAGETTLEVAATAQGIQNQALLAIASAHSFISIPTVWKVQWANGDAKLKRYYQRPVKATKPPISDQIETAWMIPNASGDPLIEYRTVDTQYLNEQTCRYVERTKKNSVIQVYTEGGTAPRALYRGTDDYYHAIDANGTKTPADNALYRHDLAGLSGITPAHYDQLESSIVQAINRMQAEGQSPLASPAFIAAIDAVTSDTAPSKRLSQWEIATALMEVGAGSDPALVEHLVNKLLGNTQSLQQLKWDLIDPKTLDTIVPSWPYYAVVLYVVLMPSFRSADKGQRGAKRNLNKWFNSKRSAQEPNGAAEALDTLIPSHRDSPDDDAKRALMKTMYDTSKRFPSIKLVWRTMIEVARTPSHGPEVFKYWDDINYGEGVLRDVIYSIPARVLCDKTAQSLVAFPREAIGVAYKCLTEYPPSGRTFRDVLQQVLGAVPSTYDSAELERVYSHLDYDWGCPVDVMGAISATCRAASASAAASVPEPTSPVVEPLTAPPAASAYMSSEEDSESESDGVERVASLSAPAKQAVAVAVAHAAAGIRPTPPKTAATVPAAVAALAPQQADGGLVFVDSHGRLLTGAPEPDDRWANKWAFVLQLTKVVHVMQEPPNGPWIKFSDYRDNILAMPFTPEGNKSAGAIVFGDREPRSTAYPELGEDKRPQDLATQLAAFAGKNWWRNASDRTAAVRLLRQIATTPRNRGGNLMTEDTRNHILNGLAHPLQLQKGDRVLHISPAHSRFGTESIVTKVTPENFGIKDEGAIYKQTSAVLLESAASTAAGASPAVPLANGGTPRAPVASAQAPASAPNPFAGWAHKDPFVPAAVITSVKVAPAPAALASTAYGAPSAAPLSALALAAPVAPVPAFAASGAAGISAPGGNNAVDAASGPTPADSFFGNLPAGGGKPSKAPATPAAALVPTTPGAAGFPYAAHDPATDPFKAFGGLTDLQYDLIKVPFDKVAPPGLDTSPFTVEEPRVKSPSYTEFVHNRQRYVMGGVSLLLGCMSSWSWGAASAVGTLGDPVGALRNPASGRGQYSAMRLCAAFWMAHPQLLGWHHPLQIVRAYATRGDTSVGPLTKTPVRYKKDIQKQVKGQLPLVGINTVTGRPHLVAQEWPEHVLRYLWTGLNDPDDRDFVGANQHARGWVASYAKHMCLKGRVGMTRSKLLQRDVTVPRTLVRARDLPYVIRYNEFVSKGNLVGASNYYATTLGAVVNPVAALQESDSSSSDDNDDSGTDTKSSDDGSGADVNADDDDAGDDTVITILDEGVATVIAYDLATNSPASDNYVVPDFTPDVPVYLQTDELTRGKRTDRREIEASSQVYEVATKITAGHSTEGVMLFATKQMTVDWDDLNRANEEITKDQRPTVRQLNTAIAAARTRLKSSLTTLTRISDDGVSLLKVALLDPKLHKTKKGWAQFYNPGLNDHTPPHTLVWTENNTGVKVMANDPSSSTLTCVELTGFTFGAASAAPAAAAKELKVFGTPYADFKKNPLQFAENFAEDWIDTLKSHAVPKNAIQRMQATVPACRRLMVDEPLLAAALIYKVSHYNKHGNTLKDRKVFQPTGWGALAKANFVNEMLTGGANRSVRNGVDGTAHINNNTGWIVENAESISANYALVLDMTSDGIKVYAGKITTNDQDGRALVTFPTFAKQNKTFDALEMIKLKHSIVIGFTKDYHGDPCLDQPEQLKWEAYVKQSTGAPCP